MRIAVVGGGPGGLYFAALAQRLDPRHEITVWERNAPDDTFGFGVVFSDETLGGIEHADPAIHAAMEREFARWDDIDVHYRGEVITSGGHGFAAMSRRRLLGISPRPLRGARGPRAFPDRGAARSRSSPPITSWLWPVTGRTRRSAPDMPMPSRPDLEQRRCRYMWLGTDKVFDAFTFEIEQTPYGVMQIHGYPYDERGSTFIVEMHDDVWRTAGFDATEGTVFEPGQSDDESVKKIRELFAHVLDGHELMANNSRWLRFATIRNARWRHQNMVLLGDAAHTAHFSIGSGTKLAMEDALALAASLHEHDDLGAALAAYETSADRSSSRPSVLRRRAWSGSRTSASTPTRSRCGSPSTSSPGHAGSPTTTSGCGTRSSSTLLTRGSPTTKYAGGWRHLRHRLGRRCSSRSGCAACN